MKRILFLLTLTLFTSVAFSQRVYRVYKTEMHTKNSSGDWELYSKNSDTKIEMCIEDNFLTIWAKSPSVYKIYKEDSKDISGKTYKGTSYGGRDLKEDERCVIHILSMGDGEYMISIFKLQGYNLRYFLRSSE